jgi:hypothetical protein
MSPTNAKAVATPQSKTVRPSKPIRKRTASTADAKTQTTNQKKEKEAALAVIAKHEKKQQEANALLQTLLDADARLYGKSVQAILTYAKHIEKAENELNGNYPELQNAPWKDFQEQCKGKSYVSRWLKIAKHTAINDPKNLQRLPASFTSLYELAVSMSAEKLNAACKNGTLNPKTTRNDARALTGKPPQTPVSKKRQLAEANDEDHMDAAEQLDAEQNRDNTAHTAAHAAVLWTRPIGKFIQFDSNDTEITAPLTFTDPLEDDGFFRFDLTINKDPNAPEIEPRIYNKMLVVLTNLKTDLPTVPGLMWQISLKPATDLVPTDTLVA